MVRTATLTIGGYEHTVTQAAAADCDSDGTSDIEAIIAGAADCNSNGTPDTCDIADGTETDYNGNGIPDSCESSVVISVPKDFLTIQAAIDAAQDGWIVEVAEGLYREAIDLGTKTITVEATGAAVATIIDGELTEGDASSRVPTVVTVGLAPGDGFATIRGFTITGGQGGTEVAGQAGLFGGGGIYLDESDARIESCVISGNSAGSGGGVFFNRGSAALVDCVVSSNSADADGGGVYFLESNASVTGTLMSANVATLRGGGVYAVDGSPTVLSSSLSGNSAGDVGGGIGWYAGASPMALTVVLLEANVAANLGDAVWVREGYSNLLLDGVVICGSGKSPIAGEATIVNDVTISAACEDCDENGQIDAWEFILGTAADGDGDGEIDDCECPADLNRDGRIDGEDLGVLLLEWGPGPSDADLDGDSLVDGSDLGIMLLLWGMCE